MYRFMRKYNRKLLAIFAVGLMIAFIIPSTMKGSGRQTHDVVRGRFAGGGEPLRTSDLARGKDDIDILSRLPWRGFANRLPVICLLASQQELNQMVMMM